MHYVYFSLICLIWGSSFFMMKKAAIAFSPVTVGWGRLLGGALFLAIVCLVRHSRWNLRPRDIALLVLLSLFGYGWPYAIQPWLVQRHGSSFIGLSVSFVPLLTILVSITLLRVYLTPRQFIGVLGALVCMGGLVWDGLERNVPLLDLGFAFSVPFAYAVTNTLIRRQLSHIAAIPISVMLLGVPVLALLPLMLNSTQPAAVSTQQLAVSVVAVLILGVLGTGWTTVMFNSLIHSHGPLFAGMVTYLVPLGALVWGWLDRERITLLQLVSLAGVLIMVAIAQTGIGSQKK